MAAKIHLSSTKLDPKAYGGSVQFGNPECQRVTWKKTGRANYRVTSDSSKVTCTNCLADKHIDYDPVTYKGN